MKQCQIDASKVLNETWCLSDRIYCNFCFHVYIEMIQFYNNVLPWIIKINVVLCIILYLYNGILYYMYFTWMSNLSLKSIVLLYDCTMITHVVCNPYSRSTLKSFYNILTMYIDINDVSLWNITVYRDVLLSYQNVSVRLDKIGYVNGILNELCLQMFCKFQYLPDSVHYRRPYFRLVHTNLIVFRIFKIYTFI